MLNAILASAEGKKICNTKGGQAQLIADETVVVALDNIPSGRLVLEKDKLVSKPVTLVRAIVTLTSINPATIGKVAENAAPGLALNVHTIDSNGNTNIQLQANVGKNINGEHVVLPGDRIWFGPGNIQDPWVLTYAATPNMPEFAEERKAHLARTMNKVSDGKISSTAQSQLNRNLVGDCEKARNTLESILLGDTPEIQSIVRKWAEYELTHNSAPTSRDAFKAAKAAEGLTGTVTDPEGLQKLEEALA